jgi:protein subunit release factor A
MQKDKRTLLPFSLIMNLGQKIYLLQEALSCLENQIPKDCFLLVETRNKGADTAVATLLFAQRLCIMYKKWIKKRRMRSILIQEKEEKSEGYYRSIIAVSGSGGQKIPGVFSDVLYMFVWSHNLMNLWIKFRSF